VNDSAKVIVGWAGSPAHAVSDSAWANELPMLRLATGQCSFLWDVTPVLDAIKPKQEKSQTNITAEGTPFRTHTAK
jgi:hypothetical protein